jgi:hypothetical protein
MTLLVGVNDTRTPKPIFRAEGPQPRNVQVASAVTFPSPCPRGSGSPARSALHSVQRMVSRVDDCRPETTEPACSPALSFGNHLVIVGAAESNLLRSDAAPRSRGGTFYFATFLMVPKRLSSVATTGAGNGP